MSTPLRLATKLDMPLQAPSRARTAVAIRFQQLLSRLESTPTEQITYGLHAGSVERALGMRSRIIGSFARGTYVRRTSDLDLLVTVPREEARHAGALVSSASVLGSLRDRLNTTFARTEVRRDGQAIVVHFGDGSRCVDVVPGVFDGMVEVARLGTKRPAFLIPTGDGRWQRTSPEAHDHYLADEDRRAGHKLRSVAKLIKHWRLCRTPEVPLQSFHVELVLAATGVCVGPRSYSQCLREAFAALASRSAMGLRDPLGISGIVPAASTQPGREACHRAVVYAADHSSRALEAEYRGQFQEAQRQWNIVFNNGFPR